MIFYSYFSSTTLSNSYILGPDGGGDAVIIDPGTFNTELLKFIEDNHLYIKYILITHSHDSHIMGIRTIMRIYNAEIFSYRHSILDFKSNRVRDFMKIPCSEYEFEVLETPGHTGDSVIFKVEKNLFTGDSLFAGTIGNVTDGFARGLLLTSLKEKILTLDDGFFIFPGHGAPSKLGIERKYNPDFIDID